MGCHVINEKGTVSCERFIHDQRSQPGTGQREAFGFYDPGQIYNARRRKLGALSAGGTVHWHWVRGHNGHAGNERADGLATRGMREARDTV
ncbi:hypothetical protein FNL55_05530 [Tardiphaga sp. vice352]|nr:hypothetical protein FNL53_05670 [Tardiphaga sp. vice278]QDM24314.1 hypothetical protein FIU28_04610 [Tardiphaga sp. vice154]QDM29521.1 hypothetical protein FNL56_05415 [Tardiphaga sp. vice304]QDM34631.1 hypothetical protein FNL55_05530 [Tardiphaga sp. vice352]